VRNGGRLRTTFRLVDGIPGILQGKLFAKRGNFKYCTPWCVWLMALLPRNRQTMLEIGYNKVKPRMKRQDYLLMAALGLIMSAFTAQAASPLYSVTDLGTLGGPNSSALAINDRGQVVGASDTSTSGVYHAFLYSNGKMQDLGTLTTISGGNFSVATAINNHGQAVGQAGIPGGAGHVFLYSAGYMQDVTFSPILYDYTRGANGINNRGEIVGNYSGPNPNFSRAFLYRSGQVIDLTPSLSFSNGESGYGIAFGINDLGQVVGLGAFGGSHAFLYSNGITKDLGTIPGTEYSEALAINNKGEIVRDSRSSSPVQSVAFLYSNGVMKRLSSGFGSGYAIAYRINDRSQIIGNFLNVSEWRACLFSHGNIQDLNSLLPPNSGWVLNYAHGINNIGQIVGYGTINGKTRAFLLTLIL
jgi:probable HAF family extracellular repeat protein